MSGMRPVSIDIQNILDTPAAWEYFREGIEVHWLSRGLDGGPSSALLKYQPGASAPRHNHPGFEHIYVLRGSQTDENGEHAEGTLAINPPGTSHSVQSPDGCIVFAVWEKPVQFEAL